MGLLGRLFGKERNSESTEPAQDDSPAHVPASVERAVSPLVALRAFSKKSATQHDVMRSLMAYPDWHVPAAVTFEIPERDYYEAIYKFREPTNVPPGQIWIFTDYPAALRAQSAGAFLGPYFTSVLGTEVFSHLNSKWDRVLVNPGSPQEMSWFFGNSGFPIATEWAKAIALEEVLAKATDAQPFGSLPQALAFEVFALFTQGEDGGVAGIPGENGRQSAVGFTTPDCSQAFLDRIDPRLRGGLNRILLSGTELAENLPTIGIDEIVINPLGPGVTRRLSLR